MSKLRGDLWRRRVRSSYIKLTGIERVSIDVALGERMLPYTFAEGRERGLTEWPGVGCDGLDVRLR